MNRHLASLAGLVVFVLTAAIAHSQTTFTWTGNGANHEWFTDANWDVTPAPNDVATANVVFGASGKTYIQLWADPNHYTVAVRGLTIAGNTRPYYLDGNFDGNLTMTIGAGGIIYSPTQQVRSVIEADLEFADDQTWNITSGTLVVDGNIYDGASNYVFTKTGAGTLVLGDYDNNFDSSTINLNNGRLVLSPINYTGYRPLGFADLVIGPTTGGNNPIIVARDNNYSGWVEIDNDITLNGVLITENQRELYLVGTSSVIINTDSTIKSRGMPLFIEGSIMDGPVGTPAPRKLTVDSTNIVVFTGGNTYTGGTHVTNGVLIFGSVYSIPSFNLESGSVGHLTSGPNGYIGVADSNFANGSQSYFINDFDKANTHGTIGFDSDPDLAINTFTGDIDLSSTPTGTAFATDARLGSATEAILSGTITPQGTAYRFGGGGGWLRVDSLLTDQTTPTTVARSLVLDSPAAYPLILKLSNSGNNYTGGTSVTNSGLIFGNIGIDPSFPSGARNITINQGGYVGFEYWGDQGESNLAINSLQKIHTASVGMAGFDNVWFISAPIDLSAFTNALYLGTSTWYSEGPGLTVSGTITPAGGPSAPYRFAAYKGGAFAVASPLSGANGVHIGDPNSPGTFGDYFGQEYSTVALTGNNSALMGNVTLFAGQLMVGQSNGTIGIDPTNALGTGTLVVAGMTLPTEWRDEYDEIPHPLLGVTGTGLVIPNNVTLNTDLNIAESSELVFTGKVSGTGEIYLEGGSYLSSTWLSLDNDTNDFSGGIYLSGYSGLDVNANHATGTGPLGFGNSNSSEVFFNTAAPVINGLVSREEYDYATLYTTLSDTVLTINQSFDSTFRGAFSSSVAYPNPASLRIVKTGTGTLRLENGGMSFYNGTTEAALSGTPEVSLQVNQGTVIIGNNFSMWQPYATTVWVHGGTLALDSGYVESPVVVDNGGRIAGFGSFASSVSIGNGASISPGLSGISEIGMLSINHLELNSGGIYEWQIQNPDPYAGSGRDYVSVYGIGTLVINATVESPFSIKIMSLNAGGSAGPLGGFDPSLSYAWTLMAFDSLTGGFDPAKFVIDTSGFANSLAYNEQGNGAFSLSLDAGEFENYFMLNFTPVPEPSTYALMALGLGLIGWVAWRRRV
jgi:autotransporter-associated beta strand protein